MIALCVIAAAVLTPAAASATGPKSHRQAVERACPAAHEATLCRWHRFVAEASKRFDIPETWIYAVMRAESGGRTTEYGRPITSPAGAMGLMQLMPKTYAEMRRAHGLGTNPYDPRDNIFAGTAYLRAMADRFGYPGLFAAYNAGPERYDDFRLNGRPLPAETSAYIRAVLQRNLPPREAPRRFADSSGTALFVPLGGGQVALNPALRPSSRSLFVQLSGPPRSPR